MATVSGGDITYSVGVDLSGLKQGLANAQQSVKQHSAAIGASMTAAGATITGVFGKASSDAMSFGGAMAEVATLGVKDMAGLEASLKNISTAYGMDLVGSVNAAYQAISAGASEMEAPLLLESAAKAATAGVSDLTTAINLGTSVTNAFGGELSNVNVIYDQAFTAVKYGVTTFGELAASVGTLSPAFASANLGSDQMFASITALTKGGVSTSEAVTELRGIINSVVAPTEGAKKAAEELGIQWNLAALESQGLSGFLQTLKEATGGNVEQMKQFIGSAEAFTGVLSLTGTQAETFNQVLAEMRNSTGATQDAFNKLAASDPGLAWRQLKSEMQVLSVEIGQALMPALKTLMDAITPMVQAVKNWAQTHPELTSGIAAVSAAAGALMLALGPLVIALPGLTVAFGAMAAAISPVTLAIGALGTAAALWYANWDQICEAARKSWESFSGVFIDIVTSIKERFAQFVDGFGEYFKATIAAMEGDWSGAWEHIKEGTRQILDSIRGMVADTIAAIKKPLDSLYDGLAGYLGWYDEFEAKEEYKLQQAINRNAQLKANVDQTQQAIIGATQAANEVVVASDQQTNTERVRNAVEANAEIASAAVDAGATIAATAEATSEVVAQQAASATQQAVASVRQAQTPIIGAAQQSSTQIGQIAHNTTNNVVNAGYTLVNSAIMQMQQAYNYGMQLSMQIVAERNRIWNQWQQQYNSSIERWRANDPSGSYMVPLESAAEFLNQFRGPGSMPLTDADFLPLKQAGEKLDEAADKITAAVDPIPDTVLDVKAATEGLKSSADKVEQKVVPDTIAAAEKQTTASQSLDTATTKLQTTAETLDVVPPKIDQAAANIQTSAESISTPAPKLDTAATNISTSASEIKQSVTPSLSVAAQEMSKAASQVQPASFKLDTAAGALQQASSAQIQASAPLNTAAQNLSIASGGLIIAADKLGKTSRSSGSGGRSGSNLGGPYFGGYINGIDISNLGPIWSLPGNQRIAGPGQLPQTQAPPTTQPTTVNVNVAANTDANPADIAQAVGTAVQGALRGAGAQSQRGGW